MPLNIDSYLKEGYRITHQDDQRIQLVRPKQFSFLWAIFWFCFLGVGLLFYILYYVSQRDEVLVVDLNKKDSEVSCCGKDYDKTWGVCLLCNKPLRA